MNEKENNINLEILIQKIKDEAVTEAEKQAKEILETAEKEAKKIIENSKKEAENIIKETEEECKKKKQTTNKELEISARDFIINLGEKLKNNFIIPLIKNKLEKDLENTNTLKEIIKDITIEYIKKTNDNITLIVSENTKKMLNNIFIQEIKNKFNNNKTINLETIINIKGFKLINNEQNCTFDFTLDIITQEIFKLLENKLTIIEKE